MTPYLDFYNVMAYDFHGAGWDTKTGHQANLYPDPHNPGEQSSIDDGIQAYTDAGVPASKLVLGLPTYGRAFAGSNGTTGSPCTLPTPRPGLQDGASISYSALPLPGATAYYDAGIGATWSYDPATKEFVSYDDAKSAAQKFDYVKSKGLAGVFTWTAGQDKASAADGSITGLAAQKLEPLQQAQNLLTFPASPWQNLQKASRAREMVKAVMV